MIKFSINGFKGLMNILIIFLYSNSSVYAIGNIETKKNVSPVSYSQVLNWTLGLAVVLSIFFACVWFMKKTGALPAQTKDNMQVVGGLSLGMREKLVLVQVGEKQIVLAVTPGKIDNLLVLDGEDQLYQEKQSDVAKSDFSNKLKQMMTGTLSE